VVFPPQDIRAHQGQAPYGEREGRGSRTRRPITSERPPTLAIQGLERQVQWLQHRPPRSMAGSAASRNPWWIIIVRSPGGGSSRPATGSPAFLEEKRSKREFIGLMLSRERREAGFWGGEGFTAHSAIAAVEESQGKTTSARLRGGHVGDQLHRHG